MRIKFASTSDLVPRFAFHVPTEEGTLVHRVPADEDDYEALRRAAIGVVASLPNDGKVVIEFRHSEYNCAMVVAGLLGMHECAAEGRQSATLEFDDLGRPLVIFGDWRLQSSADGVFVFRE